MNYVDFLLLHDVSLLPGLLQNNAHDMNLHAHLYVINLLMYHARNIHALKLDHNNNNPPSRAIFVLKRSISTARTLNKGLSHTFVTHSWTISSLTYRSTARLQAASDRNIWCSLAAEEIFPV